MCVRARFCFFVFVLFFFMCHISKRKKNNSQRGKCHRDFLKRFLFVSFLHFFLFWSFLRFKPLAIINQFIFLVWFCSNFSCVLLNFNVTHCNHAIVSLLTIEIILKSLSFSFFLFVIFSQSHFVDKSCTKNSPDKSIIAPKAFASFTFMSKRSKSIELHYFTFLFHPRLAIFTNGSISRLVFLFISISNGCVCVSFFFFCLFYCVLQTFLFTSSFFLVAFQWYVSLFLFWYVWLNVMQVLQCKTLYLFQPCSFGVQHECSDIYCCL